jgi:hypothetical protein
MQAITRICAVLLLIEAFGCSRERITHEARTVDTPTGKIDMKVTTYPKGKKNIGVVTRELTPQELQRLEHDANRAVDFIRRYAPEARGDFLVQLDVAFAAWLRLEDPSKESASDVERIVGAAYGRYCNERLGMRWAIIQDDFGVDTALVRSDPEARGYPFTSIRYRIEDRKVDFIYGLYAALDDTIKQAARTDGDMSQVSTK